MYTSKRSQPFQIYSLRRLQNHKNIGQPDYLPRSGYSSNRHKLPHFFTKDLFAELAIYKWGKLINRVF
jgi:hypothetical protein